MSESKHTENRELCHWCSGHTRTKPIGMCRLHAAAPDLLAACAKSAKRLTEPDPHARADAITWLRAAIAKAPQP